MSQRALVSNLALSPVTTSGWKPSRCLFGSLRPSCNCVCKWSATFSWKFFFPLDVEFFGIEPCEIAPLEIQMTKQVHRGTFNDDDDFHSYHFKCIPKTFVFFVCVKLAYCLLWFPSRTGPSLVPTTSRWSTHWGRRKTRRAQLLWTVTAVWLTTAARPPRWPQHRHRQRSRWLRQWRRRTGLCLHLQRSVSLFPSPTAAFKTQCLILS